MESKRPILILRERKTAGQPCVGHADFVQPIRFRQIEFLIPVASLKATLTENWQELRRMARQTGREIQ
jgi:hypothetical protein